jgi:hypothetical protein
MFNGFAVACDGATNLALIRFKEMQTGIMVTNEDKSQEFGLSKKAAAKAILQTAESRVALAFIVVMSPASTFYFLDLLGKLPKSKMGKTSLEIGTCIVGLMVALPTAIALFPQHSSLEASKMEPEFQDKGETVFYFNKGL